MARTQSTQSELHKAGLEFVLDMCDIEMTSDWKDIAMKTLTTRKQVIRFMQEGDFGMAPIVSENSPISDDDIFIGYPFNVTPVKRGLGFSMSTEASESDQHGRLAGIVPKIKLAFNKTREQAAANRFNLAETNLGPDGKALAATDHPYDGGTQSNLETAAFGPTALEDQIEGHILTLSHRGDPDPRVGPFDLMIHPSQLFLAERTLFSAGQQGTANNDKNRVGGRIRKLIASPYFTDLTAWGTREASSSQPFAVLERRALRVRTEEDIDLDIIKYRLNEMYVFFERGFRGFRYSTGAGA